MYTHDEIRYLAEDISKESFQGVAWCFMISCSKMGEGAGELKKEL